jgi:hypothetical protein
MAKHLNETTPKKKTLYTPALAEPSEPEFWAITVSVTECQCPLRVFDQEWNVYPVGGGYY